MAEPQDQEYIKMRERALQSLLDRAEIAERCGLKSTAKSWRDAHARLSIKPDLVIAANRVRAWA